MVLILSKEKSKRSDQKDVGSVGGGRGIKARADESGVEGEARKRRASSSTTHYALNLIPLLTWDSSQETSF